MKGLLIGYGRIGKAVETLSNTKIGIKFDIEDTPSKNFKYSGNWDFVLNCSPDPYIYGYNTMMQKIPFFDLSGDSHSFSELKRVVESGEYSFRGMGGLGLAPGLVNIIAHYGYKVLQGADNIQMYCGGLPQNEKINCLGYISTWSVDGLMDNYTKQARYKKHGVSGYCRAIECVPVQVKVNCKTYESFLTYGGIDETINLRAPNISYQTLRYPGHLRQIKSILSLENGQQILKFVLSGLTKENETDIVVLKVVVTNGEIKYEKELEIFPKHNLSAMQFSTAASALATILTLIDKPVLSYSAVADNFSSFRKHMSVLGINL